MDPDEIYDAPTWRGVPATIILINLLEDSRIVEIGHIATCRLVRQYLRSGSSQLIGVYFYGVDESNTPNSLMDSQSLKEMIPLSLPTLAHFKKFKNIDFTSMHKCNNFKLSDVLWQCSKIFANCKKQISSHKIIMLTQLLKTPTQIDQTPTLKRVKDLVDSDIEIRIVNISEKPYDIDTFYINFMKEANKGQDPILSVPMFDPLEIEKTMHRESHRRLAVANLTFEIGDGVSISLGIYSLLRKSGYSHHKKADLDRESNALVSSVTKTTKVCIDSDDTETPKELPLLKSEVLFYQVYGGERIEFTNTEMKSIKNPFGPPTMKLLGFKPANVIRKEKWFLKMGYFLFPNEKIIEGSTVAFKAMHKACSDLGMIAICVLCTRANARPTVVALNPCKSPLGLDVEIGFDVIHIPFVEHVRDLNMQDDDEEPIEEAHKVVMKDILDSVMFDYKPDMFQNPKLQSEYRAIEAIAFEEDYSEPFIDTTKPNSESFQNLKEDLFEEMLGPFGALAIKRGAANSSAVNNKKSKVADIDEDLLQQRVSSKGVHQYTVPQLKQILQFKDINDLPALTGLKKADLVELVYKNC